MYPSGIKKLTPFQHWVTQQKFSVRAYSELQITIKIDENPLCADGRGRGGNARV